MTPEEWIAATLATAPPMTEQQRADLADLLRRRCGMVGGLAARGPGEAMTWTKLGDDFNSRTDLDAVSLPGLLLYVEALVDCNANLTDGFVTAAALRVVRTPIHNRSAAIESLVAAGIWEVVEGGWKIDMCDQPTRGEVEARRAARAESGRRGGVASGVSRRGEASA
jgi:hypothetical protein